MSFTFTYPLFGPEIRCPHCHQSIAALTLTDTYLCHRHGAFEANPQTAELVHLQSGQRWRCWNHQWFRQHTHADGIRFEIHEELNRLRTLGMRAIQVVIAERYRELLRPYLERNNNRRTDPLTSQDQLYGLPVLFCAAPESIDPAPNPPLDGDPSEDRRWQVINFELTQEQDPALQQSRLRLYE